LLEKKYVMKNTIMDGHWSEMYFPCYKKWRC
jgi:hypothetical protein